MDRSPGAIEDAGVRRRHPTALTWRGVVARRMARHSLVEPAPDLGPAGIASAICGAHAQILPRGRALDRAAGRGATRTAVQRALWVDRTLVKTFGPRGTVHLLATADLPTWTGALTALPPSAPGFPEAVRFTPEQAEEVIAAIGTALADTELTVDELTERCGTVRPWAVERRCRRSRSCGRAGDS